ncbi:MAG: transcription elongation factor GreA [Clostridiaceae bacterium]|nr:transcription elongation factor GreA [Clostridiales bacterium]MDD2442026.1 transcription elongation factor GreA [Eubacteriales bacterium]MDD4139010.1 transcription elongation factor GreA [Eubacteriales bacterium]MDD4744065.1 transcription elongation factor GreA [Eubacteriales bacterium]NLB45811.1 transcription elongation factor GreA [Clostridiaceae bacterium]
MADKVYEMTYDGVKKLQDELDQRKTVTAAEISERLKEARALGDLSENSEYDDAKTAQAENEMRIMEIEAILKNAKIIDEDEISKTKVTLGAVIKIRDEETLEEMEYLLVGTKEQDIFSNKISSDSPVGAAIIGKKRGQIVDVRTPAGILRYRIVKISKPS